MADGNERFGYDDAVEAAEILRERMQERGMDPNNLKDMAILGSGLGHFAEDHMELGKAGDVSGPLKVPFDDIWRELRIDPLKGDKLKGHSRELVIGPIKGTDGRRLVLAQSGREHPYEIPGDRMMATKRATMWLRVAQQLAVRNVLGSNAAGILTPDTLKKCDMMLINGDLDYGNDNPLVGPQEHALGPRNPHMDDYYPSGTGKVVRSVAARLGIDLKEGTYVRVLGPNYESRDMAYRLAEEVERMWARGSKVWQDERYMGKRPVAGVGMSTTFEAMVAQHATLSEVGSDPFWKDPIFLHRAWVGVMTNFAAQLGADPNDGVLDHAHVTEAAEEVRYDFGRLIKGVFVELWEMEEAERAER